MDEACWREVLPYNVAFPVTCNVLEAATAPVRVDAPVTVKAPPVEILVLMVVAACTVAITKKTDTATATVTGTMPPLLKTEIPFINFLYF